MCPSDARGEPAATNTPDETDAEAQYRRLLDRSVAPLCMHDGVAVRYVNPAAVRALGAESDDELVGRPITDFVDSTSLARVRGRLVSLREDGDVSEPFIVPLLRVDGTVLVIEAVAAVRVRHGRPIYEVICRETIPVRVAQRADDPALSDGATEAVITTDLQGIVIGWDSEAQNLYGRTADEVIGKSMEHAVGAALDPALLARVGGRQSATHRRAGGAAVAVRVLVIRTAEAYLVICDTTDAATRNEQRWHTVLDLVHEGVVIMGSDGRFEFTNAAARRILGSPAEDLVGVHHTGSGVDLLLYDAEGQQISPDAHPIRWIQKTGLSLGGDVIGVDRLDGRRVWITGHGCLIDSSNPQTSSVLFSFTDITEHHDARERLLHDATHDGLTGLPNRVHALNQAALGLADNGIGRLAAVLFIDLDRLKTVNDRHGHPIGDGVLRIAADRMQSVTREQDVVARIGGDEFVVLLMGPLGDGVLGAIARRLHEVIAADINIESLTLSIGASIGITTIGNDDGRSLAEVLRDADSAMYQAKSQGPAQTAYFERHGHGQN